MKKWRYLAAVLLLLAGYLIGTIKPISYFQFDYDNTPISRAEHLKIIISIVAATLTLCAVCVALFKEKILSIFSRPKLKVEKPLNSSREIISDQKHAIKSEAIEATKHISRLVVKNVGNSVATDVSITLEKLEFKELHARNIIKTFEPPGEALIWNNKKDNINIIPNGEKIIDIIEIFAPKKTSTPEGSTQIEQEAELIIGNFKDCDKRTKAGIWTATFVLNAQNHKHIAFTLSIEWQGKWKGRIADFETEYTYKIIDFK